MAGRAVGRSAFPGLFFICFWGTLFEGFRTYFGVLSGPLGLLFVSF